MIETTAAAEHDLEQAAEHPHAERDETGLEALSSICGVLVFGLFLLTFLVQNFEIPSGSMEKTLLIGDHVLVDRITLAPRNHWMPFEHQREVHHGDILVFLKPGEPDLYLVKRVVGLPGDHIRLRNGVVYRNGEPQNEPYAAMPGEDNSFPYRDDFPSVAPSEAYEVTAGWTVELPNHLEGPDLVVPPGRYFMMGDNRPNSLDSRYWGFLPQENVIGRPLFVYWSFNTPADQINKTSLADRIGFMVHVLVRFFDQTRWSRTLHLVK